MERKPLSEYIAKAKAPATDDEAAEGEMEPAEPDETELAACQDVLDAVKKGSAQDMSEALHHWMELAGYGK